LKKLGRASRPSSVREMCYIGISVAVLAVLAQISIPLPFGVPLTLQTFAVMLVGIVLGAKKAAIALLVYLLLGAFGIPVFTPAGGASGFGRIVGAWGGFLMSFPLMAFVIGLGAETRKDILLLAGLVAGVVINLSAGMLWFAFITNAAISEAFVAAFAPFILAEIIKIAVLLFIQKPIRAVHIYGASR